MINADRLHGGHKVLTRQMARELQMKKDEVREDKVVEEEIEEEKKEEAQEGLEAKEPSITESPDKNVDGVNGAATTQDMHVGPQPPPAADTNEDMASVLNVGILNQWARRPSHVEPHLKVGSYRVQILLGVERGDGVESQRSCLMESRSFWELKVRVCGGGLPGEARRKRICVLTGTFLVGLGIPTKIPVRPFDYRDEAVFQMICILRMLAFIFYRIDDLPEYLIVWYDQDISSSYMQLMKANGKRASSKAGNKNSSERRMMMNADGFHGGHGVLTRRVVYIREQSLSLPFVLKEAQIKPSSSLYSCYYIPGKLIQTLSLKQRK
ncbi:hypothetical protein DVH24_030985 [Malus domestica]|uniref:Uncharacterized protein n=1 Tax=Malus domestica TaxID=3750 RepID=A0A498HFJ9_MALDO|nr:hypothetical protein DVH24_030985 [Malus domestica]